jgi:hypothetical protein
MSDDTPLVVDPSAGRGARRRRLGLVVAVLVVVLALGAGAWWTQTDDGPPGPPPGAWTTVPHSGLGAWVDVYDWTLEFSDGSPSVTVDDIDAMAEAGVQTLYLQTAHAASRSPGVIEEDRLRALVQRAYDKGLHVVAWYLPALVDPAADLRRLVASAELPVGGLGVDIESVEVADVTTRNARLLQLSADLRAEVGPGKALAAITPSAVHLQVVNPQFWPGVPWSRLPATYDVILPMTYWSIRVGELREGGRYVGENLDRVRASLGLVDLPIAPIGGIADGVTEADLRAMVAAIDERDAAGGSLYDWATSSPEQWEILAPLRDRQVTPAP